MATIHVRHLRKQYRTSRRPHDVLGGLRALLGRDSIVVCALDDVSFDIEEGECVGYIGQNGAGKSTTIKLLTGILVPDGGEIEVAGLVPWRQRERNALNIGAVFGQRTQLWWDLPLIDSFELIGQMYRIPRARYRRNLDHFVDLLDMAAFIETPVRQLSLGQRMRGDLVAAMLYEPRILYLDEPTIGLDVLARERIRLFLEEINRTGRTTIVLTTHDLRDVERLCRRVLLIDHGRLLYDGAVDELKKVHASYRLLTVETIHAGIVVTVPGAEVIRREGAKTWLRFCPEQHSVAELIADVTRRYEIADLAVAEPELEAVVRGIYEGL